MVISQLNGPGRASIFQMWPGIANPIELLRSALAGDAGHRTRVALQWHRCDVAETGVNTLQASLEIIDLDYQLLGLGSLRCPMALHSSAAVGLR